ncbi:MAG: iron-sulfur cluster repair di-iron protein [Chloroherpetonaceae bacterium]
MNTYSTSLAEFVKQDFRTASIFEKYHMDFCCHGKMTLQQACQKQGVSVDDVLSELNALKTEQHDTPNYAAMPIDALIAHILDTHHVYVRKMLPVISEHLSKVVQKHSDKHPELLRLKSLFGKVSFELELHLHKEEQILFPYILALYDAKQKGLEPPRAHFGTVRNPVRMMEMEHDAAGEDFRLIRNITNNLVPPDDACETYKVLFKELEDFERDLHMHIFLENELVHKEAVKLEEDVRHVATL